MKINAAAFLFLSSEFKYQVTREEVFVLTQPFALEVLQKINYLMGITYSWLAWEKKPTITFSLFVFFSPS